MSTYYFFRINFTKAKLKSSVTYKYMLLLRRIDFFCYFFLSRKKSKSTLFRKKFQELKIKIFVLKKQKQIINHLIDYGFNLIKTITK
jgi:hypothetical protein